MTFLIGIFHKNTPEHTEGKKGAEQFNFMVILDTSGSSSYKSNSKKQCLIDQEGAGDDQRQ
jgi:hypothetical protein